MAGAMTDAMTAEISAIAAGHLPAVLDLNNRHEVETSWLDRDALATLVAQAFVAIVVPSTDGIAAFLIVLDQSADYDSPNFAWFKDRYDRFCYVDRIVVDAAMRGGGLARALYGHLFARARAAGHNVVCCEVNTMPANPASLAFHTRLGFQPVGEAALPARRKAVRYLARALVPTD